MTMCLLRLLLVLFVCIFHCQSIAANCFCFDENSICPCGDSCDCLTPLNQHQLYIAPELYDVHRHKKFGSKQDGFAYGDRVGYDRIKRCRIYFGAEGLYAAGDLDGNTGDHEKVKLRWKDKNIEGRIGYTIQLKTKFLPTFVPFIGYGYLQEISQFEKPVNRPIKANISYDYFTAGFLSQFYLNQSWILGLNFKVRVLLNSRCKISNDPGVESFTQHFENELQYRAELPILYRLKCPYEKVLFGLVPFYEYRHYGHQNNFPHNFIDTQLNLVGCDFRLMMAF